MRLKAYFFQPFSPKYLLKNSSYRIIKISDAQVNLLYYTFFVLNDTDNGAGLITTVSKAKRNITPPITEAVENN
jgi:hypothetical protein